MIDVTPRANQALDSAHSLARSLGQTRIGTEHLLYGLLHLQSGVHFAVLSQLGITEDAVRLSIQEDDRTASQAPSNPILDESAIAALEQAENEARALNHPFAGTEHILLGILAQDAGGAAPLFTSVGADLEATRRTILDEIGH